MVMIPFLGKQYQSVIVEPKQCIHTLAHPNKEKKLNAKKKLIL